MAQRMCKIKSYNGTVCKAYALCQCFHSIIYQCSVQKEFLVDILKL